VTSSLDALAIRKRLGRNQWAAPQPFGMDGWRYFHKHFSGSIIVTVADHDGVEWVHASIAFDNKMPTYEAMRDMHAAVFPDGWAYEVFAPPEHHINIHQYARHLWGRLDNEPAIPNFGMYGSI
jgi:hypothetical protein